MNLLRDVTLIVSIALATMVDASAKKPNIIFVLADDLGWSELGCYGNDFNETPHLDALAEATNRFAGLTLRISDWGITNT